MTTAVIFIVAVYQPAFVLLLFLLLLYVASPFVVSPILFFLVLLHSYLIVCVHYLGNLFLLLFLHV